MNVQHLAVNRISGQRVPKSKVVRLFLARIEQLQIAQATQRRNHEFVFDVEDLREQIGSETASEHRSLREQSTLFGRAAVESFANDRLERQRQGVRRG